MSVKKEILCVAFCLLASVAVHGLFVLDGFGEADAARLARETLCWQRTGNIPGANYLHRISPLYLIVLRGVLMLGLPPASLSVLMNWMSVLAGSAVLVPLYLLYRRITRPMVAGMGCLLCSFMPAFWLGNIYGMPTIVAFLCFMTSLLLFDEGFAGKPPKGTRLHLFLAVLCSFLAMGFKADIGLYYGLYFLVLFRRKSLNPPNALFVCVFSGLGVGVVLLLSKCLVPTAPTSIDYAASWHEAFPFTVKAFVHKDNLLVIARSVGQYMSFAILLSGLYCLLRRTLRVHLGIILVGTVPAYLFWASIIPNSSRHLMCANVFLLFMVASVIFEVFSRYRMALPLCLALIILNYFSCPTNNSTVKPSSRIFESRQLLQNICHSCRKDGIELFNLPFRRIIAICDARRKCILWEISVRARSFELIDRSDGALFKLTERNGNIRHIKIQPRPEGSVYGPIEGWFIWTCRDDIKVINQSPKPPMSSGSKAKTEPSAIHHPK